MGDVDKSLRVKIGIEGEKTGVDSEAELKRVREQIQGATDDAARYEAALKRMAEANPQGSNEEQARNAQIAEQEKARNSRIQDLIMSQRMMGTGMEATGEQAAKYTGEVAEGTRELLNHHEAVHSLREILLQLGPEFGRVGGLAALAFNPITAIGAVGFGGMELVLDQWKKQSELLQDTVDKGKKVNDILRQMREESPTREEDWEKLQTTLEGIVQQLDHAQAKATQFIDAADEILRIQQLQEDLDSRKQDAADNFLKTVRAINREKGYTDPDKADIADINAARDAAQRKVDEENKKADDTIGQKMTDKASAQTDFDQRSKEWKTASEAAEIAGEKFDEIKETLKNSPALLNAQRDVIISRLAAGVGGGDAMSRDLSKMGFDEMMKTYSEHKEFIGKANPQLGNDLEQYQNFKDKFDQATADRPGAYSDADSTARTRDELKEKILTLDTTIQTLTKEIKTLSDTQVVNRRNQADQVTNATADAAVKTPLGKGVLILAGAADTVTAGEAAKKNQRGGNPLTDEEKSAISKEDQLSPEIKQLIVDIAQRESKLPSGVAISLTDAAKKIGEGNDSQALILQALQAITESLKKRKNENDETAKKVSDIKRQIENIGSQITAGK